MSSSGLIYAMIVGAWAAYLVPMWLRRQDELNEARPTERFSTAIRLLTGRGAADRRSAEDAPEPRDADEPDARDSVLPASGASASVPSVQSVPSGQGAEEAPPAPGAQPAHAARRRMPTTPQPAAERAARAKVMARRRRTTTLLFLALTAGAILAAVGGLRYLWAVAIPAALLTAYVVHLRATERRRFAASVDQRRGAAAAQRLHARRAAEVRREPAAVERPEPQHAPEAPTQLHTEPEEPGEPAPSPYEADRRALVEQTDHAEWVDAQREPERPRPAGSGWDPVPVPLPTYVTAPVAPRATQGLDLEAPDAWSSARSSSAPASATPATPAAPPEEPQRQRRSRTPLFDQYADHDRKRAANE
ncbi:gephyrin-like molybdotransferase receptor GlpR [Streptomyces sp. NPDC051940]|uniref:divisome protein SepX/GlpR n=1 Tax=Streptomyces sp. NPDC051940 TaxID=3155675 RepID=UPI00341F29F1